MKLNHSFPCLVCSSFELFMFCIWETMTMRCREFLGSAFLSSPKYKLYNENDDSTRINISNRMISTCNMYYILWYLSFQPSQLPRGDDRIRFEYLMKSISAPYPPRKNILLDEMRASSRRRLWILINWASSIMSVSIFNLQICRLVCHAVLNVDNNTTHNKEDWEKLIETERVGGERKFAGILWEMKP